VACKSNQIRACAASDLQDTAAGESIERYEARQMVELLEMVLLEVGKKSGRPRRVRRDLEIVDVRFPIRTNVALRDGRIERSSHERLL
jgi:hypothetical protein